MLQIGRSASLTRISTPARADDVDDDFISAVHQTGIMAFASLGSIPGRSNRPAHIYLMKTRARNDLGDENRYGDLMKDFPLGRAKAFGQCLHRLGAARGQMHIAAFFGECFGGGRQCPSTRR